VSSHHGSPPATHFQLPSLPALCTQGYAAAYALELLELPLDAKHAKKRSHGLQILEGLLTEALPEDPREAKAAAAQVGMLIDTKCSVRFLTLVGTHPVWAAW
jgi:hypothetical protein